jgi:hypothetical protein
MTLPDALMDCGLGLSGAAVVMAMLTVFWEEGPALLLTWPRWFVLGELLILGSML